jgi:thiol-disulfide isomerase/thioredoxin
MKQSYNLKKGLGFLMIISSIALVVFLFLKYRVATSNPIEKLILTGGNSEFNVLLKNKKKPVILSFYAYWCGECLMEMKEWKEFENGLIQNNFEIILVSDKDNAGVEIINGRFPELKNIFISELALNEYSIFAFPTNYVFDKEGKLLWKSVGALSPQSLKEIVIAHE